MAILNSPSAKVLNNGHLGLTPVRPPTARQERKTRDMEEVIPEPTDKLQHEEVLAALAEAAGQSVDNQMRALAGVARLGDSLERREICRHLENTFRRDLGLTGRCRVVPFGSTVSGLGFRGCDLDIYVDMGRCIRGRQRH